MDREGRILAKFYSYEDATYIMEVITDRQDLFETMVEQLPDDLDAYQLADELLRIAYQVKRAGKA